ncbi:MAG: hypothetical protein GXP63_00845 [DPANN group archaeon]|nr:hypothetical protein [DPANN group archaeon]
MAESPDDLEKRLQNQQKELDGRSASIEKREKDLEERRKATAEARQQRVQEQPNQGTIDDALAKRSPSESIDDKVTETSEMQFGDDRKKEKNGLFKSFLANSIGVGTGIAMSAGIFGAPLSAVYMAGAFGLGYLIEKFREKEKFRLKDFFKELSTGALLSPLGLGIYSAIDLIPNASLLGKLGRVAFFSGPLAATYIYLNRNLLYFRDKIGLGKSIKSLYNGKIFSYFREAHRKEGMPNLRPGLKTAFLNFSPVWMYTLNWMKNPAARLVIGNINDVLYRILISGKKVQAENIWKALYGAGKSMGKKIGRTYDSIYQKMRRYTTPEAYQH